MPPEDSPQPTREESARLASWIKTTLGADDCGKPSNPGRVTIRRLNRVEYNNTIRDLVGVNFRLADDFPSDDVGYGFDNIGDVLCLPPVLMRHSGRGRADQRAGDRLLEERGTGRVAPRIASTDHLPPAEISGRVSRRRPDDPGAVRDPSLPTARHARRDGQAPEPRGPGARERRRFRARDSARGPGRPGLAPLPLPRGARQPAAAARTSRHRPARRGPDRRIRARLSALLLPLEHMPDEELSAGRQGGSA